MKRSLAVLALALALTACAVQSNAVAQPGAPGFWLGVWHGFIFPFAFIIGLFKPDVAVWWNSGAQATQLLSSGEVDMIATWVSRPQQAIMEGAPVAIVWNQNLWGVDNWSILAGTPNADACREFIKFASDVKRMAQQGDYYPAGVTQPEAFKYMKPETAKHSPTHPDNIKTGVQINAKYWLENQAAVTERFNSWVLK